MLLAFCETVFAAHDLRATLSWLWIFDCSVRLSGVLESPLSEPTCCPTLLALLMAASDRPETKGCTLLKEYKPAVAVSQVVSHYEGKSSNRGTNSDYIKQIL